MGGTVIRDVPRAGILRLAMHHPGKKNALSREIRETLRESFAAAAIDGLVDGVILTGAGDTYSAGGDLDGISAVPPAEFAAYLSAGHDLVRLVYAFPKPVVTAIAGIGVGGGIALALCGDVILMSHSARVGLPFLKIGFVPDWGTLHTLPRRVGWHAAKRLFLEARLVGAEEAERIGLCDAVVPDAALQEAAVERASALAAQAPAAFAETKRIMSALSGSLEEALARELKAQEAAFSGREFQEGLAAFREKRSPDFRR